MARGAKNRRTYEFEKISHQFSEQDLEKLEPKTLFQDKWIILKKMEKRGNAHCYQVCDKMAKMIAILYLEISEDGANSISNQVEISHQHFTLGNSHRFTNLLDAGVINNHVYFMVVRVRSGPTLHALFKCLPSGRAKPVTAAFLAIDLITILELLISSGHVLRNFDAKQWKLDVKTRQIYLADTTDVVVSFDKRHRPIAAAHLADCQTMNLHWNNQDLTYAPCSFLSNGSDHRMTEMDMLEMLIYLLFELVRGKLPWKNATCQQRVLEMKTAFMEHIPDALDHSDGHVSNWYNTALRNMAEHLKTAKKNQEILEKLPVRGGAWCPNGPRAGALISTVNYRKILDDFHKVVTSGRPSWCVNWREVVLDWEREVRLSPESLKRVEEYERRQKAEEIAEEWQRLLATRVHYTVMKAHGDMERENNQLVIDKYLRDEEEEDEEKEKVKNVKKRQVVRGKRQKKSKNTVELTDDEEERVKEELEELEKCVKEEEEAEETKKEKPLSARAARFARRNKEKLLEEVDVKIEEEDFELEVTPID